MRFPVEERGLPIRVPIKNARHMDGRKDGWTATTTQKKIFFFILLKRILQINDSFDWVSQPYNAEHIKIYLKNPQQ